MRALSQRPTPWPRAAAPYSARAARACRHGAWARTRSSHRGELAISRAFAPNGRTLDARRVTVPTKHYDLRRVHLDSAQRRGRGRRRLTAHAPPALAATALGRARVLLIVVSSRS